LKYCNSRKERVTTALLLAAGTGSRLYPLTQNAPKCLTLVNGQSILERMVSTLDQQGFKRLVVITGYMEDHIRGFLGDRVGGVAIDYVFSPLYKTTNNIYSLWMAREVIDESFLLLESDLVFDGSLLDGMMQPGRMAVARMRPWMEGTCVTVNRSREVEAFWEGNAGAVDGIKYKTVNIYSISRASWRAIVKRLDWHISEGVVNGYYETVFAEMVAAGRLNFTAVSFDGKPWYEIDNVEDLAKAEKLFSSRTPARAKTDSFLPSDYSTGELLNAIA